MKYFFIFFLLVQASIGFAQDPCEISENVIDSIGSYQSTKPYLVHERNFGHDKTYLYLSSAIVDGTPTLNFQYIRKSKNFMVADCFNSASKIYLQLQNGKVMTMIYAESDDCGTGIRAEDESSNRVLSGNFYFTKGSLEDLKNSPVTLLKVRFASGTSSFIFSSSLKSELDGLTYHPETYFQKLLGCLKL